MIWQRVIGSRVIASKTNQADPKRSRKCISAHFARRKSRRCKGKRTACFEKSHGRYHRGQQYSITALTDSSATIKERYAYSAYGVLTITDASGTVRTATAEGNRYTYTGREWDGDVELYHFRARMYDPLSGRFLSWDPIGYEDGGFNQYQFVLSNPVLHLDPSGMLTGPRCKLNQRRFALLQCRTQCASGGMKYKGGGLLYCVQSIADPRIIRYKCECTSSKGGLRSTLDPIYQQMKKHCGQPGCGKDPCDLIECGNAKNREIEAQRCFKMRRRIQKCFGPGDKGWPGHQQQVIEAMNKAKNCGRLFGRCLLKGTI